MNYHLPTLNMNYVVIIELGNNTCNLQSHAMAVSTMRNTSITFIQARRPETLPPFLFCWHSQSSQFMIPASRERNMFLRQNKLQFYAYTLPICARPISMRLPTQAVGKASDNV